LLVSADSQARRTVPLRGIEFRTAVRTRLTRRGADGWAIFDTGVISVSVALLIVGSEGGNSWIKQLRVLRAFRLFRLLGKMGDLKKIVTAVAISIAPTLQALASAQRFPPAPQVASGPSPVQNRITVCKLSPPF
jgi:hypothetical protein